MKKKTRIFAVANENSYKGKSIPDQVEFSFALEGVRCLCYTDQFQIRDDNSKDYQVDIEVLSSIIKRCDFCLNVDDGTSVRKSNLLNLAQQLGKKIINIPQNMILSKDILKEINNL